MKINKITLIASISAGLEYYDFVIYALLSTYIANQFFPAINNFTNILKTLAIFSIGYFIRPIGGVIFGHFGDKYGRKKIFLISILLMANATFLIGILPTYKTIGISSTIFLVLLRILQGISFGAELPGSLTFLVEHTEKNRGLHCSYVVSSVGIGVMLASLILYMLTKILNTEQMYLWGWRIPFIFGSILAILSYFLRRHSNETPHFLALKTKSKFALTELLKNYFLQLLKGMGIMLCPATIIIFALIMPLYLQKSFNYKSSDIYLALTCGYIFSAILLPIFGLIADKIGKQKMLFIVTINIALLIYFLFKILNTHANFNLFTFVLLYQLMIAALAGGYFPVLAESFPTHIRFSAVAFTYNVSYAIASLIPLLIESLYKITNNITNYVVILFIFLSIIAAICSFTIKNYLYEKKNN